MAFSTKALVLIVGLVALGLLFTVPSSIYYAVLLILPVNVELGGIITVSRVVILIALLAWLFHGLTYRAPWPRLFDWPEGLLAMAFFGGLLLSNIVNDLPNLIPRIGPFFIHAVIFFSALTFVRTKTDVRRTLYVLCAIAVLEALLVLFEVYFNFVPFGGIHEQLAEERGEGTRATGTSSHPIWLSGFFLFTIPVTATLSFLARRYWMSLLLVLAAGLQLLAWWYTYSRSGMIGMAALLFAALVATSKVGRVIGVVIVVATVSVLAAYKFSTVDLITDIGESDLLKNIQATSQVSSATQSFKWRTENWAMGWEIFKDHPLFGTGSDIQTNYLLKYISGDATAHIYISPAVPHNQFLMVAADNGIITLFFFISLWVWAFISIKKAYGNNELRLYGTLFFVVLIAQLAHFTFNPYSRDIWLTLALSAALGKIADLKAGGRDLHKVLDT